MAKELVGNPAKRRLPRNHARDLVARSVHDLQEYHGVIYTSFGNWMKNYGKPIDVYSIDANDNIATVYRVQEEQVNKFRVWDDTLIIPGIDGCRDNLFGSVYTKDPSGWKSLGMVPRCYHVTDAVVLDGTIYATGFGTAAQLAMYDGNSWVTLINDTIGKTMVFRDMAPIPDSPMRGEHLLIFGNSRKTYKPMVWRYFPVSDILREVENVIPYPSDRLSVCNRPLLFGDKYVLYMEQATPYLSKKETHLVVWDIEREMSWCGYFDSITSPLEYVRDVVVREDSQGDICYVMSAVPFEGVYKVNIFSSRDLCNWTEFEYEESFDCLPYSLEVMNGYAYVGVGAALEGYIGYMKYGSGDIYKMELSEEESRKPASLKCPWCENKIALTVEKQ